MMKTKNKKPTQRLTAKERKIFNSMANLLKRLYEEFSDQRYGPNDWRDNYYMEMKELLAELKIIKP